MADGIASGACASSGVASDHYLDPGTCSAADPGNAAVDPVTVSGICHHASDFSDRLPLF